MDRVREYFNEFDGVSILIAFKISEDLNIKKYSDEYHLLYNKVKVYSWRIKNEKKLLPEPGSNKDPGEVTNVTIPGVGNNFE